MGEASAERSSAGSRHFRTAATHASRACVRSYEDRGARGGLLYVSSLSAEIATLAGSTHHSFRRFRRVLRGRRAQDTALAADDANRLRRVEATVEGVVYDGHHFAGSGRLYVGRFLKLLESAAHGLQFPFQVCDDFRLGWVGLIGGVEFGDHLLEPLDALPHLPDQSLGGIVSHGRRNLVRHRQGRSSSESA
jgi:hypothetical protein